MPRHGPAHMKNPCLAFTLLFTLAAAVLAAQPPSGDTLRYLLRLPTPARLAAADHLGQLYTVRDDNVLEKYAPDGRLLLRYSSNRLGQVTAIDVSNPLKIMVWYSDFRTALLLDRNLTLLGEVSLLALGYPDVRWVATASDGNLWAYDEVNFRLLKISPDGEKRAESQALNLLEHTPRQLMWLREQDNRVWLADSTQTLLVFNAFGQYERAQHFPHPVGGAQIMGDKLIFLTDTCLVSARWPVAARSELPLPAALRASGGWLGLRRLFVRREHGLEVYGW
ncbi:MAG TPA: hypothetical protein PKD78_01680 [Saprospiraceae bacterium]|nr:hypothetical protein [Saprospiraceae bacterium]